MTRPKIIRRDAGEHLHRMLSRMVARGDHPACADPRIRDYWVSEREDRRACAVAWCAGCNLLALCDEAAEEYGETYGVWGGRDRTR
jgi:hypothetical protein